MVLGVQESRTLLFRKGQIVKCHMIKPKITALNSLEFVGEIMGFERRGSVEPIYMVRNIKTGHVYHIYQSELEYIGNGIDRAIKVVKKNKVQ